MSTRGKLALGLIAGGVAAAVTGELLGVFSPVDEVDTITDLVLLGGLAAVVAALGLLGWAAWHFVDSYRDRRR